MISNDVLFWYLSCHFECKISFLCVWKSVNVEDRKKSFCVGSKVFNVLCTLLACQQTFAIAWWLYLHSLKKLRSTFTRGVLCFGSVIHVWTSCIGWLFVAEIGFWFSLCLCYTKIFRGRKLPKWTMYTFFVASFCSLQKIVDMCVPTIEFLIHCWMAWM